MTDPTPTPPPPYLPAVAALAADAPPGEVTNVYVRHDRDCPLIRRKGGCTCRPVVAAEGHYVLWFRPKRGRPWEAVAAAPTEREAWDAVATSGKRHGDWMVILAEREP